MVGQTIALVCLVCPAFSLRKGRLMCSSSCSDFPPKALHDGVLVAAGEWLKHQVRCDEVLRTALAEHALGADGSAVVVTAWLLQCERLRFDLATGADEA